MTKTEIALKYGGKAGSSEYYTLAHTLNYVDNKHLPELVGMLEKILQRKLKGV